MMTAFWAENSEASCDSEGAGTVVNKETNNRILKG